MKKRVSRSAALILAVFVVLTGLPVSPGVIKADALKSGYAYDYEADFTYGHDAIRFRVKELGIQGTCANAIKHAGKGKCKVIRLRQTNKYVRVAYYYSDEVKNWWSKSNHTKARDLKKCFQLMNAEGEFTQRYGATQKAKYQGYIDQALTRVKEAPPWFYVYKVIPKDSNKQTWYGWKKRPVKVTIRKIMQTKNLTPSPKGMSAYKNKFAGIRYGLYSDQACTKLIGEWRLGASGKVRRVKVRRWSTTKTDYEALRWTPKSEVHKWITVKPGTYYIKEIETNKYFKKNTNVRKITVKWSGDKSSYTFVGNEEKFDVSKALIDAPKMCYIKLKKSVEGGSTNDTFTIKLSAQKPDNQKCVFTFDIPGNGTEVIKQVYAGKYKVEEVRKSGYRLKSVKVNGRDIDKNNVIITPSIADNGREADAISIEVTNKAVPTGEPNRLEVEKDILDKVRR